MGTRRFQAERGFGLLSVLLLSMMLGAFVLFASRQVLNARRSELGLRKDINLEGVTRAMRQYLLNPESCAKLFPAGTKFSTEDGSPEVQPADVELRPDLTIGPGKVVANGMKVTRFALGGFTRTTNSAEYGARLFLEVRKGTEHGTALGSPWYEQEFPMRLTVANVGKQEKEIVGCSLVDATGWSLSCDNRGTDAYLHGMEDDLGPDCVDWPPPPPGALQPCPQGLAAVGIGPRGIICNKPESFIPPREILCAPGTNSTCTLACRQDEVISPETDSLGAPGYAVTYLDESRVQCSLIAGGAPCRATCYLREAE